VSYHHHHHPSRPSHRPQQHYTISSRRHLSNNAWNEVFQNAIGSLDKRLDMRDDMKQRQRQRRRRRYNNDMNGIKNYENDTNNSRIEFVSPLLEDGYPPAVIEYEQQQQQSSSLRSRYTSYDAMSTTREQSTSNKPILLYLPGFDGTILAPFLQFPSLGEEFDVRAMKVDMEDRSTFEELKEAVINYLLKECQGGEDEDGIEEDEEARLPNGELLGVVYLMGESFGGILATEIALELNRQTYKDSLELGGLILVNPATSYLRSCLPALQDVQYVISLVTKLVPLFLDKGKAIQQLITILSSKGLPSVVNNPQREAYMGRVAFDLPNRLKFMPKDTLKWRLEEWLEWGCGVFEDRLDMLHSARDVANTASGDVESSYSLLKLSQELRTLIVVGEYDLTLPSIEEATRLSTDVFRNARVHIVPGAGHASTCGGSLNLIQLLREVFPEINVYERGRPGRLDNRFDGMPNEELHGLVPRYDRASIGLNPLLYWSKEHYRKWRSDS
jgi:pimeloyl-ACP methyl ester carboxylesterase